MNKHVSLKKLSGELGFHPSSIRKAVIARGYEPFRLSNGNNKPLFLKHEDAESLKERIMYERNNAISPDDVILKSKVSGVYFIVVPSYDGKNRVKIGWSTNLCDRLSAYRTIIPDLIVKGLWQTNESWCEKLALKCAENFGARVHQELFEFDDIDSFLLELTDFFSKIGKEVKKL